MSSHHFNTNPIRLTQKEFTQLTVWEAEGPRPGGSTHSLLPPVLLLSSPSLFPPDEDMTLLEKAVFPSRSCYNPPILQEEGGKAGLFVLVLREPHAM